jgi:uracil-DNA glycosylase
MATIDELAPLVDQVTYPVGVEKIFCETDQPAFFPGGTGIILNDLRAGRVLPRGGVLVLGHNFGTAKYVEQLKLRRKSELYTSPTWRGLCELLDEAGITFEACFFSNALMGAIPGDKMEGSPKEHRQAEFRSGCVAVFCRTLELQQPSIILALGLKAIEFLAEAIPELEDWRELERFAAIDAQSAGPVRHVTAVGAPRHVVALVHPSRRKINVRRRQFRNYSGREAERAMVSSVWPASPPTH